MSRNIRSNVTLLVQARQLMGLASASLYCSVDLFHAAQTIEATGRLDTDTRQLFTTPGLAELAAHAALTGQLSNLLDGPTSDETPLAAASLLTHLGTHLGGLERDAVTSLAADALREDGWHVLTENGEEVNGIEAWRDDDLFLVAVTDGGQVITDQAGTGDCAEHQACFEARLAERGAIMTRVGIDEHDPATGPLVARAAATAETSLAAGIARHATTNTPSRAARRGAAKSQTAKQVRIGGEARR